MSGHVLITRPHEDAGSIAAKLASRGYQTTLQPFLKVVYKDAPLKGLSIYDGLVFTSANGVRAFCRNTLERDLPVWAVGEQTKAEAQKNGFQDITSGEGNVRTLENLLCEQAESKTLLYIRGKQISCPLTRVHVTEIILYHTEKIEKIPDNCVQDIIRGKFSHILFYSKRTAESFVSALQNHAEFERLKDGLKVTQALCLGDSMVQCLSVLPWQNIKVATEPNQGSLLALFD